ncbi:MAG: HPr family phosphocarrier protein, partial [Pseudomonadota bacterium]
MAEQVRHVTIVNSKGLHARASARLARLAANLETPVQIELEGATADARSIMDLLCLGAAQGMQLNLIAN